MKDWKEHLGKDDEKRLNEMLHKVEKYRNAYRASRDVKSSQFWAAMLEYTKHNKSIMKRIELIEAMARKKEKPVVIEKIVREDRPSSYWQLPVGALPLLLSVLILANISIAESASQFSFATSLFIAFSFIVFAGFLWFSSFKS